MQHRIMKPILELSFTRAARQDKVLEECHDLFYQALLPVMEEVLDASSLENETRHFERIEIDLGVFVGESWKHDLKGKLKEALMERLVVNLPKPEEVGRRTSGLEEKNFHALIFFLESGHMPWWAMDTKPESLVMLVIEKSSGRLRDYLRKDHPNEKALKRLISATREQDLERILQIFMDEDEIPVAYDNISRISSGPLRDLLKKICILLFIMTPELLKEGNPEQVLKELISYAMAESRNIVPMLKDALEKEGLPDQTEKAVNEFLLRYEKKDVLRDARREDIQGEEKRSDLDNLATEEIYIGNAGLVLLYPFLEGLFNRFGWLERKMFMDPFSREQAARLISFLVDEDGMGEENMVLNKILCGMEPGDPLFFPFHETGRAREACEKILRDTVAQWPSMEKTSPAALRETFLLREGKLVQNEGSWILTIERKAVDILLGKVPWPLSVVKLPWMNKILYVQW